MKKKFDIKSTLAVPTRPLTPEQVDIATRQIHTQSEAVRAADNPPAEAKKPRQKPSPRTPKVEKPVVRAKATPVATPPPPPQKPARRDPNERRIRLSVDVLPATHKQLKLRAIQNDTDMMRYVEMLIEKDLMNG